VAKFWGRSATGDPLRGHHTILDHTYHFPLIAFPSHFPLLGTFTLVTQEGHAPHFMGRRDYKPRGMVARKYKSLKYKPSKYFPKEVLREIKILS
jgi:hypothetical protein